MRITNSSIKKLYLPFLLSLLLSTCQSIPMAIHTPTSTTIPISTPTIILAPQLSLAIPLSTTRQTAQAYKRATFSISFTGVRDLGLQAGSKLNFTKIISIKPEFQATHHLIGIIVSVKPTPGHNLIWRIGQVVLSGNSGRIVPLDYLLTPQGAHIEPLGFCTPDLSACESLGMILDKVTSVFTQPSQTVRVFAVPNSLQDFTYYTLWDDPDYVK